MSAETNKATVLRYFLESHNPPYNLDVMDETCSPEFAEAHKNWQRGERAAFPDKVFTIEHVIAEDDKVMLHWIVRGTHLGEIRTPAGTVQPTGKTVSITGMAIYQVTDGRIIEEWNSHDWLGGIQQLGAEIRFPGQAVVS